MNFKVETISIANRKIDRIEDEDGVYWYPLKAFFLKILCKNEVVAEYRDGYMSQYLKVFDFKQYHNKASFKTWCINERGLKRALKNLEIGRGKNEIINELRRKNLTEACIYFGIDRIDDLKPKYINEAPDLKDYEIWSVICIKNDLSIDSYTAWKRCIKCGYYYPDSKRYFTLQSKKKTTNCCLQCEGRNFVCSNKVVQFIYRNDGLDLLYKIHEGYSDEAIVNALVEFMDKGGAIYHDD